jgi:hypothetical protein
LNRHIEREREFTEFEREILFYYVNGYNLWISYSNFTGLSHTISSYINQPELYPNYNITLHDVSKLELRDLMFQTITFPRSRVIYGVYACSSEETLYAYEVEPWNETANMKKLHIYRWFSINSN